MAANEYVIDTHALYWYLLGMPQLGPNALAAFQEGERGQSFLYIPTIVLAELYYLNEKLGRPLDYREGYLRILSSSQFVMVDLHADDILLFDDLAAVPEMHDRIICGAALRHKCPCVTRDASIVSSGLVQTVW